MVLSENHCPLVFYIVPILQELTVHLGHQPLRRYSPNPMLSSLTGPWTRKRETQLCPQESEKASQWGCIGGKSGFPEGSVVKNPPASAGDTRDPVSIPWVGKIWRREWQPIPVFLPGKSHGQRSLAGSIESMGSQRVGHDWAQKHSET